MSEQLYRRCPDCNGRGSISVMNGQGHETEYQCERCYHGNGYVIIDKLLMTRAEWEASEHQHQFLPWLTLPNGSSWTGCASCDWQYQYDHA